MSDKRWIGKNCAFCGVLLDENTVPTPTWNRVKSGEYAHLECFEKNGKRFPPSSASGTASVSVDPLTQIIATAVTPLVREEIKEQLKEMFSGNVRRIEVSNQDTGTVIDLGLQHKCFADLLAVATARDRGRRLNGWVVGPAGTGKTTAIENISKALGTRFGFTPALKDTYGLMGVISPTTHEYRRTLFREIWEYGGVFCFDDFDSSLPDVCVECNAFLANGVCAFPDGVVPRHADCVLMLTANTFGNGGASLADYCGRFKLDAAFIDRFVQVEWPIDEDLELATCPNTDWAKRVQDVRRKVHAKGIKVLVTPRASYNGAALLSAGLSQDKVEAMTLRKGMTPDQWEAVR